MSKIILCADDSVTMQRVAEITFKATDYTYVGARSADEAIQKAKAQKPALVLADAVMPNKTGYDLCQSLKSDPALADVPVVILCGNSQAYDPARGAQVGADGSLQKPWDTQVMLDKVAEFLDRSGKGDVVKPGVAAPPSPAKATMAGPPTPSPGTSPPRGGGEPPRSATIMGMPSIKLPPQMGGPGAAVATPAAAAPPAPPPISSGGSAAGGKPAAMPSPNVVARAAAPTPPPAPPIRGDSPGRTPMVSGIPTKRSALVERTLGKMAARLAELSGLEPGSPELMALLKLSTEVVERVVWEVVPDLAEQIIRENLQQLAAAKRN